MSFDKQNWSAEFNINKNIYSIRLLTYEDEKKIQNLCENCLDYYELVEGIAPEKDEGRNILSDLPPNKELKDKFVLGVFNEKNKLIALLDIIKDYKYLGEWIIGLFLIEFDERGKGLGTIVHKIVKDQIRVAGGKNLRIGVVDENIKGHNFWYGLGYREQDRVAMQFTNKKHGVIIMNTCI